MPLQYVGMPLHCVRASFQPVHASRQPVRQPIPPAGTGQPQAGEPILYDRTRQQAVGGDKGVVGVQGAELFRAHPHGPERPLPVGERDVEADAVLRVDLAQFPALAELGEGGRFHGREGRSRREEALIEVRQHLEAPSGAASL